MLPGTGQLDLAQLMSPREAAQYIITRLSGGVPHSRDFFAGSMNYAQSLCVGSQLDLR